MIGSDLQKNTQGCPRLCQCTTWCRLFATSVGLSRHEQYIWARHKLLVKTAQRHALPPHANLCGCDSGADYAHGGVRSHPGAAWDIIPSRWPSAKDHGRHSIFDAMSLPFAESDSGIFKSHLFFVVRDSSVSYITKSSGQDTLCTNVPALIVSLACY